MQIIEKLFSRKKPQEFKPSKYELSPTDKDGNAYVEKMTKEQFLTTRIGTCYQIDKHGIETQIPAQDIPKNVIIKLKIVT